MKRTIEKLEHMLNAGGTKKDIALLAVSGAFLALSLLKDSIPAVGDFARNVFDPSCVAIILCGVPIVLEALIGLVTAFDIKADVLVSMALVASKVGEDSSLQRMIKLVKSADAGKAKIVGVADRWATWIVVTALTAATLAWIFTREMIRAVTILVVFCPCSLVLATPTAIMAAIGNATKHGFLVRQGDALERLAKTKVVTFDKTGTLTYGKPEVVAVEPCMKGLASNNLCSNELYMLCAAAEQLSEHPLGHAVVECYSKANPSMVLPKASSFEMVPGQGVKANVQGRCIYAGNLKLMTSIGADIPQDAKQKSEDSLSKGCSVIFVALDGSFTGFIALSDTVRSESAAMVKALKDIGVKPVLLTGDNPNSAWTIAKGLRINEIHANCLPEDKLNHIDAYQKKGLAVCMVGDGINDAPALKKADVGIAMGGVGRDIAVDAADIALVDDEVKELPHLIRLSKRMMETIAFNMTFSMTLNVIAIVLAIIGTLNPVVGALVHNAGSVFVITNSAFLLNWRKRERK